LLSVADAVLQHRACSLSPHYAQRFGLRRQSAAATALSEVQEPNGQM